MSEKWSVHVIRDSITQERDEASARSLFKWLREVVFQPDQLLEPVEVQLKQGDIIEDSFKRP